MESNELLEILAQAGGVDEGVWQQLHRLYDLQAECSPPSQAAVVPSSSSGHRIGSSSGSRLSRSTELDYSTASNTPGPDSLHQNDLTANDKEGRLCADRVTSSFIDADSDADVDTLEAYRQKRRFSDPITSALMAVADANASAARHLNCGIRGAFGGMERALRDGSAQHRASNTSNSAEATTADGYNSFPLGRRGVRYTDVWEEEDFLQKVNKAHALTAVDDRSSLLHSYSDTHDGPYRDWNMRHTAAIAAASKKEAALSSSRWSRISLPPNGVGNDCGNKGFCVLAPPVPVSIFHPSCWSMTARKVAQNTFVNVQERITQPGVAATGDLNPGVFELVHPAALSSSIVELPGAAALRERLTDIDDLTILGDALSREVCAVEASNYLRLQSLSRAVDISCQLSGVRLRKAQLIEALVLMYQRNEYEYEADRRLAYANMPSPPTPVIPPFSSCPGPWTLRATKDKGCSLPSLDADARKVCAPEEPLATLISARQPRCVAA